jgi:hypothetical protein
MVTRAELREVCERVLKVGAAHSIEDARVVARALDRFLAGEVRGEVDRRVYMREYMRARRARERVKGGKRR